MKKQTIALIGSGKSGVILKTDISEDTFQQYKKLCKLLNEFQEFDGKLSIVSSSARELEAMIAERTAVRSEPLKPHKYEEDLRHLNNASRKFLSDLRMYLDHAETRIIRTYGKESPQYLEFKKITSLEYDTHFEYRFCSQLRNAMHSNNPFESMPESQQMIEGKLCCQTKIVFDPHSLLAKNNEWKSAIRKELEAMDEFPAAGVFDIVMESLRRINSVIFISERDVLYNYAVEIKGMVQEALDRGLAPSMGLMSLNTKMYEEQTITMEQTPLKTLERLGVIKASFRG